jgi:hypothetical protein
MYYQSHWEALAKLICWKCLQGTISKIVVSQLPMKIMENMYMHTALKDIVIIPTKDLHKTTISRLGQFSQIMTSYSLLSSEF